MPTYEYACTKCGERLEAVQSFHDAALTKCPACKGKLRKLFSPVGVVFKGSGFYKTDSRSGKPKTAATASSGSGNEAKSSEGSGTTSSTSAGESSSSSTSADSGSGSAAKSGASSGSSDSTGGGSKVA